MSNRDAAVDGRGPRPLRIGGGGGGVARGTVGSGVYAKITARAGTGESTPPYIYAAVEVAIAAGGEVSVMPGGLTFANIVNLAELGDNGQWLGPLLVDDIVEVKQPDPTKDVYVIDRVVKTGGY